MDKLLILNKLIEVLANGSESEFAKKIDVKPQVITNWKSRNTFNAEKIYTNCLNINPHFLLTGEGEVLKNEQNQPVAVPANDKYVAMLEKNNTLLEENKALLQAENERLKAEIQALKSAPSVAVNQFNQPSQAKSLVQPQR